MVSSNTWYQFEGLCETELYAIGHPNEPPYWVYDVTNRVSWKQKELYAESCLHKLIAPSSVEMDNCPPFQGKTSLLEDWRPPSRNWFTLWTLYHWRSAGNSHPYSRECSAFSAQIVEITCINSWKTLKKPIITTLNTNNSPISWSFLTMNGRMMFISQSHQQTLPQPSSTNTTCSVVSTIETLNTCWENSHLVVKRWCSISVWNWALSSWKKWSKSTMSQPNSSSMSFVSSSSSTNSSRSST